MSTLPITVCRVETPDGEKDYVVCQTQEQITDRGLFPESIVGMLTEALEPGNSIEPSKLAVNPAFLQFFHGVIARRGPDVTGIVAEANRQGSGYVYIIDRRTKATDGSFPPEDIIGVFTVENGQTDAESYRASDKHQILSDDGFFQLEPELLACLLDELANLPKS